ncbi:hypothetical protein O181_052773 [Austropuccinia psidii MF-1]|uniref:Integrase catalytic domain-containing protein n=1 Tax=Austropuccinia psidii MF-1 TaxID=1389203 RepID=A0A9Q3E661_9BASI|nr:hypothetical protein [Austropuccinia psidii MF-1]
MGNMSEDKTKERIGRTAWCSQWEQEFGYHINNCYRWNKSNRKHGKKYELLQHIEEPKNPWEIINIDWVTGLVPGEKENFDSCVGIVDIFSNSLRFLPCHKEDTAIKTALIFWHILLETFGMTKIIIHDRNPQFT